MLKLSNKPTVTIAVSALNEEKNISNWLDSVLNQKEKDFIIEKIIIHSDGSTDETVKIINSFKDRRIKLFAHNKRQGKSFRLNEIYNELQSDFLVQSDADVVFSDKSVISELIKPFLEDPSVMMCGGNSIPAKGETFVEKALEHSFKVYSEERGLVRSGNNVFSVDGKLIAYRKKFCKTLSIPNNMIGNDTYTYFACISSGNTYRFSKKAIVFFRFPVNIKDHIKQNIRFEAAPLRIKKIFGETIVNEEFSVPKALRTKLLLNALVDNPIYSLYIYTINKYSVFRAKTQEKNMDGMWEVAISTKVVAN